MGSLQDKNQQAKHTEEGSVIAKYMFLDTEYSILMALQEKWRSKTWGQTWYSLLYTFWRHEATKPEDRIYAFLELMSGMQHPKIVPDYSSSTSTVFTGFTKSLTVAHKHLLIFNLKRESVSEQHTTWEQSQVYSLLDQIRFLDPKGQVMEGEGQSPRKGWVRLPDGWERRQDGYRLRFYDHSTGTWHDGSPVANHPPSSPQHMNQWRNLPP